MTDTAKTQDELLQLFADNTSGDISAQDLRDLVATSFEYTIDKAQLFACWGDSLTAGAGGTPYPTQWGPLMDTPPRQIYNGGVSGDTSVQIRARFEDPSRTAIHSWATVFWVGRNNANDPDTVKSDIAAMVAALGHDRYIVMSIINGNGESVGTTNYNAIISLNNDLQTIYGDQYLDIRSFLVSQYDPSQQQDVTDHQNDIPPTSLKSDFLHLNTAGYGLVAQHVMTKLPLLLGPDRPIGLKTLADAFATPYQMGDVHASNFYLSASAGALRADGSPCFISISGDKSAFQFNGGDAILGGGTNIGRYSTRWRTVYAAGFSSAIATKTSAYSIIINADGTILADATTAAFTVTLPPAGLSTAGVPNSIGRTLIVKKIDSSAHAVTINTVMSQTIDGASTYTLTNRWQTVQLQSDGNNWFVIGTIPGITTP